MPDIIIGSVQKTLPVIVYTAFTCSHCADFHLETLTEAIKEFVEPGKIHIVLRDFPLDRVSLALAQLARAAGPKEYQRLSHVIYAHQEEWIEAEEPLEKVKELLITQGVTAAQLEKALKDKELEAQILNRAVDALNQYKLDSTPSIVIGDRFIDHSLSIDELRQLINEALAPEAIAKE